MGALHLFGKFKCMKKAGLVKKFFVLLISSFFLLAFVMPGNKGADDKPQTHPYQFGTPVNLLQVINPNDNPATEEGVELGRKLFYDPILSGNQKQACSGCHRQEFAFTDGKEISTGSLGQVAKRNSMTLVNLGWIDKYFWDGRASTLEELIHFPVTDPLEMNADTNKIVARLNSDKNYKALFRKAFGAPVIGMGDVSKALSQFLRTIVSYNAPMDLIGRDYFLNKGLLQSQRFDVSDSVLLANMFSPGNEYKYNHDAALQQKIKQIGADDKVIGAFTTCIKCHYNSLQIFCMQCNTTIPANGKVQFKNNGLEVEGKDKGRYQLTQKEEDKYLFKVPTLRNISFTGPYMHDGRFKTLEEVIEHYNTGIQPNPNLDPLLMDSNKQPRRFNLNTAEKKQLLELVKLFSDSTVLTDKRFSDPGQGQ